MQLFQSVQENLGLDSHDALLLAFLFVNNFTVTVWMGAVKVNLRTKPFIAGVFYDAVCSGRLGTDAKSVRPPCFGAMNHMEMKHDYTQSTR